MKNSSGSPESGGNTERASSSSAVKKKRWGHVGTFLVSAVFPVGLFSLLTGLFWIGDHGLYSKLFYWLVALPVLLMIAISPRDVTGLRTSPVFMAYLPFACYMAVTAFWSEGEDGAFDLVRRPLYVMLLFLAIFEFGRQHFERLVMTVKWSAVLSVFAAIYTAGVFFVSGGNGRLTGIGALYNPLLVSHVFGFFLALWLGFYFCERKLFEPRALVPTLVLAVLLLATGSRTPMLATVVTIVWLAVLTSGRKGVVALGTLIIVGTLILLNAPELITQRGLSYRTEIWTDVLGQIGDRLWFGHGYATPLAVPIEDLRTTFSDPHNLTLSVLYAGGIVGGALWALLYAVALKEAWHWRRDNRVLAFSATVVYGFAAGMTEGGAFLSRPKEHWFLIWIPMALLSAAAFRARSDERTS